MSGSAETWQEKVVAMAKVKGSHKVAALAFIHPFVIRKVCSCERLVTCCCFFPFALLFMDPTQFIKKQNKKKQQMSLMRAHYGSK